MKVRYARISVREIPPRYTIPPILTATSARYGLGVCSPS